MPPYGVLIRVAAYTGLRPCEFVALRVARLDLLRGTVRVAEAAPEVAGHLEWGGVKTHEARTVRLPRSVAEELGGYLADRPHGPGDLVFTAPRGGLLRESKFLPGRFKPAIGAANEVIAGLAQDGRPDPLPEFGGAGGGARTLMPCGPNAFKARLSADSSTPALTSQARVSGPARARWDFR
jgi:integrase